MRTLLRILVPAAIAVSLFGQTQVSSGDIRGSVTDQNSGALVGAKVTASEPHRNFSRSVTTDASGEYRLPLLPPDTYRVRIEAAGFTTKIIENVEVRVGEAVNLRTALEVGAITTEITIAADAPAIETERTQQATTIESGRIENLPINRRNYLGFALLAPGVVETNDMVDGTDLRVVQTPHSGLSFGGSNGRGNSFAIDGVENYMNSGGVRPSVSQEAVQEFQINRNSYSAEFGGAIGGAINIISKSGTNEIHGNLFGFLRHRDIQARNYFDPGKSAFTRGQYGATFGAPVHKDRTFLFASFERLDRHETAFVPILQDRSFFGRLTPSQQELATFFDNAPVAQLKPLGSAMRQALITNNFPRTVALFDANSGNFPFGEDSNQVSLRLDHRTSAAHMSFLRANFTKGLNQNAQFGALIGFSRGRSIDSFDGTLVAGHTWVISPRWVSQTRLMYGYNKYAVQPTDPYGPELNITGYGNFGREIFLPSTSYERHYQFQEVVDFQTGRHGVKFGVDINPIRDKARSETFFSGRFNFGEGVPLASVLNSATRDPNFAANLIGMLNQFGQGKLAANVMAPITALQAYNLGLPLFYQQGFGNPDWTAWFKRYNFFLQDSIRLRRNLTFNIGGRYELEIPGKPVPTDPNNIAPRLGLAWTPFGEKTVIRAGYGLFYSRIDAQVSNLPATLNGTQIAQAFLTLRGIPGLNNPRTGQPLTSADIYQTLLAQGVIGKRSITLSDIAQFNLRPGGTAPGRVIFDIVPDFVNPYSQQASLEIEHAFGDFAVGAGYSFNRGAHLVRNLDRNLYYTGRTAYNQPTFGFYDPTILQYNVLESTANSFYHAMTLQVSKRFSRFYSLNAHYTFAKAMDEVTDYNSDFQPQDQLNARAERALSSFDQRHRFVANAVVESPLRAGRGKGLRANLLGDFTFSPILMASSGRPFNIVTGFDNLGDNHTTTHRPFGAGRNIGLGPDYFSADLRLSRRVMFGKKEQRSLEFTAEGFNLLNRTNFKSLNNTVGDIRLEDLPHPIVGLRGNPTSPLSFASAFDPRQFQFGVKINF